jgi:N-acyl-D-amino-acid deacylase
MAATEHFDLIVRNATIIDGTRAPRYRGEIGVRGDKIVKIGALDRASANTEIDGSGLIAAPGFIDAHTHDDRMLLSNPDMAPKASQGVTTVVAGNCGISLAHSPANGSATPPLDLLDGSGDWFKFPTFRAYREELAAHPAAINATCLVGHTTFRVAAMDRLDRAATPAEIAKMRTNRWRPARSESPPAPRTRRRRARRRRKSSRSAGRCPNSTDSTSRTCATRTTTSSSRSRKPA